MSDSPSLPLRADNNPKFYSRFKWLGLAAIGFMLYCLYDGYVNWPEQQARGLAFMEVAKETLSETALQEAAADAHGSHDVYTAIRKQMAKSDPLAEAWATKAEAEGWPAAPPKKLRTDGDIAGQYIMAAIALLGAIYFLTTVLRTNGRWIELNEDGIATSWGETFSLNAVTAIDKRQWRDKGIARVRYKGDDGRGRTFVVDDYKYHRKTTDQILRQIEQLAGVDKITNGKPEPDPAAAAEPQNAAPATVEETA